MTVINTNVKALFAQNSLSVNGRNLTNAMQQLSTGSRINSAKDDAAGLAIGTRMTADLRGMSVAMRNANDGISMMQTAEGALGEISNMLQRMRDLSVQAATGTVTSANREAMQAEVDQLVAEIDNVARTTNFNRISLLDGSAKGVAIQTGVQEGDQVGLSIEAASSKALGLQGFRVEGQVTSGRVTGTLTTIGVSDVQINGKDAFVTAPTADTAAALATAINTNVGQHRVTAAAFNTLEGAAPTATVFAAGALEINSTDVGAASSVEELVSNINRDIGGVIAVLGSDGTIELSNDTGANIVIAGSAPTTAGFTAGTYKGYVTLSSLDGEDISILAKNAANGYTTSANGTLADVQAMGFNESSDGAAFAGIKVSTTALDLSDDLRINGVKVGVSADASALSKAAAINAVSEQSGVTATASTEVKLTIDMDMRPQTAVAQVAAFNTDALSASVTTVGKFLVFSDGTKTYQATQTGTTATDLASLVTAINGSANANVTTNGYTASLSGSKLLITAGTAGTALTQEFKVDYNAVKEVIAYDTDNINGDGTAADATLDTAGDRISISDGINTISVARSAALGTPNTAIDTISALAAAVNNDTNFNTNIVASRSGTQLVLTAKNAGTAIAGSYTVATMKAGVNTASITALSSAAVSNQQGVTVGEDLDSRVANVANGATQVAINGSTVDLRTADSTDEVVTAINNAGINGVQASTDDGGNLILTSITGANVTVTDSAGTFITAAQTVSGEAGLDANSGAGTSFTLTGRISLASSTGADIRVESKITGSAAKIGFQDQGGSDTLVGGALSVTTQEAAGRAITAIDAALDEVSMSRSTLGAFQNRLTAAVDNLASGSANLAEARGRIMDTDYAKATTELARTQIVQQAATAMLAQANQQPQMVLSLLQ